MDESDGVSIFVADHDTWARLRPAAAQLVNVDRQFPDQVLRAPLRCCCFLEFAALYDRAFIAGLHAVARAAGDTGAWLLVLEPDGESYFLPQFGLYPAVSLRAACSDAEFHRVLHADPGGSPADALAYNARRLVFFAPSRRWVLLMDKEWDIGVLGADRADLCSAARGAFGSIPIYAVEDVIANLLPPVYGRQQVPAAVAAALSQNYAAGW